MSIHLPVPVPELIPIVDKFIAPALLTHEKKPAGRLTIDWDHPLADGLIKAFFFVGGDLRDYVNHDNPIVNGTIHSNRGLEQTGSEVISWPSTHFDGGFGSVVFDFTSNGTAPVTLAKIISTQDNEFQIFRNSDDITIGLNINATSGGFSDLPDMWDQKQHKISIIWNDADNFRRGTFDNITKTSASAFSAIPITADLHLLNRADGNRATEGTITYCFIYAGRNLSRAEEDKLHKNPYQFLKPVIPLFFPAPELEFLPLPNRLTVPELLIPGRKPTEQVQIDWTAIPKSIAGYWLLNGPEDLVGKNPLSLVGNAIFSGAGLINVDGNTDWAETGIDPVGLTGLTECTVVMEMTIPAISSADDYVGVSPDQGLRYWQFKGVSSSNNSLGFDKDNSGDDVNTIFANDSMIENSVKTNYVFRWSNGGTNDVWRSDGYHEQQIDASPGSFLAETGMTFFIGNFENGGETVHSCQIYSKALPDALCQSLAFNPYQFLIPATKANIPYEPKKILKAFVLPDPRFEKPALLTRGKKPAGRLTIDWDHWAAKGLIRAYFFVGGDMRDYVLKEGPLGNTTTFSTRGLETVDGEVISWEGQHGKVFNTNYGTLIHDFTGNGTAPNATARFAQAMDNNIEWRRQASNNALRLIMDSVAFNFSFGDTNMWDQNPHTIAVRWNDLTNEAICVVDDKTDSDVQTYSATAITTDLFILNASSGVRSAEGRMTYFLAYDRALSITEMREVQSNPYQMLIPA